MKPYWSYVTKVAKTLAMKIGALDKDGVDLVYTIGQAHKLNNVTAHEIRTKFKDSLENAYLAIDDGMHTDMAAKLRVVFDQLSRSKLRNKRHTLLILTDGLWEGSHLKNDVEDAICAFMRWQKESFPNFEKRRFSIQFISFGNNAEALARLQRLDDELLTQ